MQHKKSICQEVLLTILNIPVVLSFSSFLSVLSEALLLPWWQHQTQLWHSAYWQTILKLTDASTTTEPRKHQHGTIKNRPAEFLSCTRCNMLLRCACEVPPPAVWDRKESTKLWDTEKKLHFKLLGWIKDYSYYNSSDGHQGK